MRVFRDLEIVEQLGSGIPRILKTYGRDAFEIRKSYVRLIFMFNEQSIIEPESGPESLSSKILLYLEKKPLSKSQIAAELGHSSISSKLNQHIRDLLNNHLIEMTIPEKPNSRLQKYRITQNGLESSTNPS